MLGSIAANSISPPSFVSYIDVTPYPARRTTGKHQLIQIAQRVVIHIGYTAACAPWASLSRPIAKPPGRPSWRVAARFARPKESHSLWPTAVSRFDLRAPQNRTSASSSISRGRVPSAPAGCVRGHSRPRKRRPSRPIRIRVRSPLQNVQMPFPCGVIARAFVPRAIALS